VCNRVDRITQAQTWARADLEELGAVDLRVIWDPRAELALIHYPRPVRIEDEAGIYAWEAVLERRVGPVVEARGVKVPAVVGIDNLWVAPRLERRYAELADKVTSRWFSLVVRWTARGSAPAFFARAVGGREPFTSLEQALAHVASTRSDGRALYSPGE
jgi:hypothetical protein